MASQAPSTYKLNDGTTATDFLPPANGYIAIPIHMGATALFQASLAILTLGNFLL